MDTAMPLDPASDTPALAEGPDRSGAEVSIADGLFAPTPTRLSDFTTVRRRAIRPLAARDARFDEQFDDDTLFFDAFRAPRSDAVILLGPSYFNLAAAFDRAVVRDRRTGGALPLRRRDLDRHAQLWVDAPPAASALTIDTPLGRIEAPIGSNRSDLFAGRRVLLTRSRNNPLPWILDWIRFHRDINGADAVLFYDNASTLYTVEALQRAIAGVAGIRQAVVVRWPFKYGPQGPNGWSYWDSDFCELGAWEHARWKFLARARSVMTGDVDELAFGRRSVFEIAETSWSGVARYYGRWVLGLTEAAQTPDLADRRHRDYETVLRRKPGPGRLGWPIDTNRCSAKWTVVPSRCPARAQWRMHAIGGWPASYLTRRDVTFGHFRPINTSWKYQRDDAGAFDPRLHERDADLAQALGQVDWSR